MANITTIGNPVNRTSDLVAKIEKSLEGIFQSDNTDILDNIKYIDNIEDLEKLLAEVLIRFDNDPKYYVKRDFYYLIILLCKSLPYLYGNTPDTEIPEDLVSQLADLESRLSKVESGIEGHNERILKLEKQFAGQQNAGDKWKLDIESQLEEIESELDELKNQEPLTLEAGSGIEIVDNVVTAKMVSDNGPDSFKVIGNIGGYSNGDEIKSTDNIVDVLKTILQQIVKVKVVEPKAVMGTINRECEFGFSWSDYIEVKLTQGSFVSESPSLYPYSENMDCELNTIDSSPFTWMAPDYPSMRAVATPSFSATSYQEYSGFTAVLSTNTVSAWEDNRETTTQTYTKTSIPVQGKITIIPYYYIFFGEYDGATLDSVTSEEVRALSNKQQTKFPLKDVTLTSIYTNSNGKSILIACPAEYTFSDVQNSLGVSIKGNFLEEKTIDVAVGKGSRPYNLYLYPITNGTSLDYKNLTFKLV